MGAKYTDLASTTTTSRFTLTRKCLIHLSDGTLVYMAYTGTAIVLKYTHSKTAVDGTIATLDTSTFFGASANFGLCRDSSDNLYVIGQNVSAAKVSAQAFTKGTGYTWTQQIGLTAATTLGTGAAMHNYGVAWCNTGGGTSSKGHILGIFINGGGGGAVYAILDAGALLAGSGTLVTSQGTPTAFLSSSSAAQYAMDLSANGFGATSGVAISVTGTNLTVGAWAVNSAGGLSTDSAVSTLLTTHAVTGSMTSRAIWISNNLWAIVFSSSSAATQWSIARYSSTAQLTAAVDSGAPTNMPLNSTNLGWDAFVDSSGKIWLLSIDGGAPTQTIYRLGCAVSSGVTWDTTVITEDTFTNIFSPFKELRAVRDPIGSVEDWQCFIDVGSVSGTYEIAGDTTTLSITITITKPTLLWNVRVAVSLTRTLKWNVIGRVTLTRILKWNVLIAVSTTRTIKWNVLTAVSTTRTLLWNTIGRVNLTRTLLWNVLGQINLTRTLQWNTYYNLKVYITLLWWELSAWTKVPNTVDTWTPVNDTVDLWTPVGDNSDTWSPSH